MSANSKQGKLFTQWRKVLLLLLSATLLEAFSFLFIYRHFLLITTTLTCFWVLFWSARAVSSQVVSKNQKERKNNSLPSTYYTRERQTCAKNLRTFKQWCSQEGSLAGTRWSVHRQAILILMAVLWLIVLRSNWCTVALKFCCASHSCVSSRNWGLVHW